MKSHWLRTAIFFSAAVWILRSLPPEVLDFADLEYISSAGLGVLLIAQKRVMQSGGGLRIINLNRHIGDIFRFSGFDKIFTIEVADG